MISAAIVGGTGYTGVELIRLLSSHSKASVDLLTSRSNAGIRVDEIFPSLRGVSNLVYQDMNEHTFKALEKCDVVFFATPHGVAMQHAERLTQVGVKVIDLAADFRLQSLQDFETWYKHRHACPQLLKQAVYGLPELMRNELKTANVVGNPGCYPTTAIVGLKPVIQKQNRQNERLIAKRIIIDAKSGISGAGRKADIGINFAEAGDNFKAYGVAGHRHLPEIVQGIEMLLNSQFVQNIRFVPHLVPMIRGMFSTIHLELTEAGQATDWQAEFENNYCNEPFVDVLPQGQYPDTRSVRASNKLRIAVYQNNEQSELTVLIVQDNLVKGAAGQAVQNMNVMFGFDEKLGLMHVPIVP